MKNLNVCKIEFAMNSLNLTPTTFYLGAAFFFLHDWFWFGF